MFWSSDILTGNQTVVPCRHRVDKFWSSDILTGNQTDVKDAILNDEFWSSDILTGNQTMLGISMTTFGFGAVTF